MIIKTINYTYHKTIITTILLQAGAATNETTEYVAFKVLMMKMMVTMIMINYYKMATILLTIPL